MKRAFTMIELMVVIGIIGILMAIMLGTFGGSTNSARAAQCQANMRNLAMAVQTASLPQGDSTYGFYPPAGSFKQYKGTGTDRTIIVKPGWISWTPGGDYQPTTPEDIQYCLTNGASGKIWKALKGSRECYRCPSDVKCYKSATWSYVMNAYFEWASVSQPRSKDHTTRRYPHARADRVLLFAEIDRRDSSGDEKSIDPILQYKGCAGDGEETIGFGPDEHPKHLDSKKKEFTNVCFADGHVEKFYNLAEGAGGLDLKDVTRYLCNPVDDDGKHVDISYNGKEYEKVTAE